MLSQWWWRGVVWVSCQCKRVMFGVETQETLSLYLARVQQTGQVAGVTRWLVMVMETVAPGHLSAVWQQHEQEEQEEHDEKA